MLLDSKTFAVLNISYLLSKMIRPVSLAVMRYYSLLRCPEDNVAHLGTKNEATEKSKLCSFFENPFQNKTHFGI